MSSSTTQFTKRMAGILLVGTVLGGWTAPAWAQETQPAPAEQPPAAAPETPQPAPAAPVASAPVEGVIRSIRVAGSERLEPETVRSYANLNPGQAYNAETLDQALKDLYATELFADVVITGADTGNLVITVRENPVINRIVLEGNKRIKNDKITPEIKLAPRQIYTRSKVRADVDRIIELYRRQGRFAATVEPKIVELDQNRVDLIFEITEGDKSKVRAINIIGNEEYSDGRLRKEMFTKEAGGILGFFKSNDSYDPDRLAADQQKLRAFYLTEGYADFRVVSALAELTPDRRDFIITYVVEEGPRFKFGTVDAESELRDFNAEYVKSLLKIRPGDWFNAKAVEDTVTALNEIAGARGYAFADVSPNFERDAEAKTMSLTFRVGETPRVYVERINIQGNTVTRDKVIRREFRLNEGDAFNAFKVKRSQDRIQNLGYFQENLEIKQTQGSSNDRVVLNLDVEEKSTGELQLSAGYSSLEKFIISSSIAQRNFMGKGQVLQAGVNWSRYSRGVSAGFSEPYLFDKNILLGGELFYRDFNSFVYDENDERDETYGQQSLGGVVRLGFPVTEYVTFGARYSLIQDDITLDEDIYFTDPADPDGNGPLPDPDAFCDPLKAGRYLCDELGKNLTSAIGVTVAYDNTNGIRATRGHRIIASQDFAGLGGDVKYLRTRLDATKYWGLPAGFILSVHGEGGYIHPLEDAENPDQDGVRLTDRFFGPTMRGFDIRGIGPRVVRLPYIAGDPASGPPVVEDSTDYLLSDALGGRAYYMGRIEVEFPTTSSLRSMGLRPSAFVDIGSVFKLKQPDLVNFPGSCTGDDGTDEGTLPDTITLNPLIENQTCLQAATAQGKTNPSSFAYNSGSGFRELFLGNSAKPRLSVGIGVNWVSPFGPLRIDIAKALMKQEGDETKLFSFNVGTQF